MESCIVAPRGDSPTAAATEPEAAGERAWDAFQSQRTFSDRLSAHEPVYFIGGASRPEVKFQISLKYRLLNFGSTPGPHAPATLQIAYTQRSLWDVGGPSSPFYDTSYMPEIFFQWLTSAREPATTPAGVSWLGLQSGLRHESNGRDGAASRSLNVAYVRPLFSIGTPRGWHVLLSPQLYAYLGGLSDNPDLPRYRGHMELRAAIGRGSAASLTVTVIPGEHFAHGSRQLDLTIPVRFSRMDFTTFLLLQYFDGYGESLLSYNQSTSSIRAGIELVR